MKLYLARHAEALDAVVNLQRPLSETGHKHAQEMADFLHPVGVIATQVYHSGILRAQQTAEILASSIAAGQEIGVMPALNQVDDLPLLLEQISGLVDDALLVGHIPVLPRLVAALVVHDENQYIIDFQPATLVCLQKMNNLRWYISWVLTPELLG